MRWLIEWLLEDVRAFFNPGARELKNLRSGMARARARHRHHQAHARDASERAEELLRRVQALEMSREADVSELVAARRELMLAEGDLRHHRSRANQAKEAHRLMKVDREHLEKGRQAQQREHYEDLLDR